MYDSGAIDFADTRTVDISIHRERLLSGFPFVASTPININRLEQELSTHPNRCFIQELITGLREGFHTGMQQLPTKSYTCKNMLSAIRNPEVVTDLLSHKLKQGYVIGAFDEPPFEIYRINPLGIAERKYSIKKILIFNLSAPHNIDTRQSLNSLIDKSE